MVSFLYIKITYAAIPLNLTYCWVHFALLAAPASGVADSEYRQQLLPGG
jgi:hypothetical protein